MTLLEIAAPKLDYELLAPLIVTFAAAGLGVLVEAVVPRKARYLVQTILAFLGLAVAFLITVNNLAGGRVGAAAVRSIMVDGPSYFSWAMILGFAALALMLFAERRLNEGHSVFVASAASTPGSQLEAKAHQERFEHTEVYPLVLFAVFGMMVFVSANDLLTLFVALEVFSLPLYLMCGLALRRRLLSQESALKYFLMGALSSGFFIYGVALLYGYSGSFELGAISAAVTGGSQGYGLLVAGMVLLGVGILFKLGAVPFHTWTPDVYQGAPTPVTAFMAICTKLAAAVGLLRVFYVALGAERWTWQPAIAVIAIITMILGVTVAIAQTDVKRMLAYSSIAHAGFILVAVVGTSTAETGVSGSEIGSVSAILFYLLGYGFATIGSFAIVSMVEKGGGESTALASYDGLAARHPWLAAAMTVFMLSFAGIPLTAGFIGKLAVFASAWRGGYAWLVVIAVIMSVAGAYFYLRVVRQMYFAAPAKDVTVAQVSLATWLTILIGVVASIVLGLFGGPMLQITTVLDGFLR